MEEDELSLPADTLAILNEFLQEKAQREREETAIIESKAGKDAKFEEDWQLSQFWYSDATKKTLALVVRQLLEADEKTQSIALLSCPSLYAKVKEVHESVKIFEYDRRFAAYGDDYVFYDFNESDSAECVQQLSAQFDIIIADPPFLSEHCISKMSHIIRKLQKPDAKIIFCSGDVVEPWLQQYLALKKCHYKPEHERNLGNEFSSYANFDMDKLINT